MPVEVRYCERLDKGDCDDTDKCRANGCRWIEQPPAATRRDRSPLVSARIDFDGIFVGGHSWWRISLRMPRWYAVRMAKKRRVIA